MRALFLPSCLATTSHIVRVVKIKIQVLPQWRSSKLTEVEHERQSTVFTSESDNGISSWSVRTLDHDYGLK
ncbi:hypothetical protein DENSPDRAFT_842875 [Dentipellis sp. KUC8613]|nr:hypothetical protein DENSPDRAFT_842875 [Dentipellis sp. KUC8613]